MKVLAASLLLLTSMACSGNKAVDEERRAAEALRQAEARSSRQKMEEKAALDRYEADARASCRTEISRKLKSPLTIVAEATTVKWDPAYLTGDRSRTRQQFPASESLIVTMLVEGAAAGRTARSQFACQVVCLDKGYCNTVSLKP